MTNNNYLYYISPYGTFIPTTITYTTSLNAIINANGNLVSVPMVEYNGFSYIGSNTLGSHNNPTLTPDADSYWSSIGVAFDSSKFFATLASTANLAITSTASVLPLSTTSDFVIQNTSDITLASNIITLPKGYKYVATINAQGNNFSAVGDELKVYLNIATVDSPLVASSIGILATSAKGTQGSVQVVIDTTAVALAVEAKAIISQVGGTANITYGNMFTISIIN